VSKILLSIKPEYVKQIFDGSKKFEFRKHLARDDVQKIIIYSTVPEKLVVGEVEVLGTLSMKKTPLWEYTKNAAGICRKNYREYYKNCEIAHAYILGTVIKYDTPKNLEEFGVLHAPQSFIYLDDNYIAQVEGND
jgi:predicted transcriptional regulator